MAHLSAAEVTEAVSIMTEHYGLERLRDKLASLGAFSSRKGLKTRDLLAARLYRISGGLRLQVGATYAFSAVWSQMLGEKLGEDGEKELEGLADKVNACLTAKETIEDGKEAELDSALGAYRTALSGAVGADAARLDMLLKAVPQVAERLRTTPTVEPVTAPPAATPEADAPPAAGDTPRDPDA